MAYGSYDNVVNFNRSLSEQVTAGKVTTSQVNLWIKRADDLINTYCGQRYAVPFTTAPPLIVDISEAIAEFYWLESSQTPPQGEFDWIKPRYNRAIALLVEIGAGRIFLFNISGGAIDQEPSKMRKPYSDNVNIDKIFTMEDFWDRDVDENYP